MSAPSDADPLDAPHLWRLKCLLGELKEESERGTVLVSATVLDEQLAECIVARLVDHKDVVKLVNGFNAPLGTFAARTAAAFGLGCISEKEYRDIDTIRQIRNDFAHRLEVGFNSPQVANRCSSLSHSAQDYGDIVVGPRDQFTTAVVALILNLSNRPHYVACKRLVHECWPY